MSPAAPLRPGRHIAFLLGKPPKANSLFPELFRLLEADGLEVSVSLPHQEALSPHLAGADLIVHRGLKPAALAPVKVLEDAGVPLCNTLRATELTHDRLALTARLRDAHVPIPLSITATSWAEAKEAATTLSVIKTVAGADGRGAHVVAGTRADLPAAAPFGGPYLVQPFILNEGFDRKLYVAGRVVRGLLKPSPLAPGQPPQHTTRGAPFEPDAALAEMARRVGEASGLELYGVDVLLGEAGPVVVDVNPFPGFRGVADAPQLIAEHLLGRIYG